MPEDLNEPCQGETFSDKTVVTSDTSEQVRRTVKVFPFGMKPVIVTVQKRLEALATT